MIVVFSSIYVFIWNLIVIAFAFMILLMLLRQVMNSLDVNPFTWHAMMTRKLSDPFINPVKQGMRRVALPTKYAAIVTIVLLVVVGFFALQLVEGLMSIILGVLLAARAGIFIGVVGYLLYGFLSLYGLMIFMRIILSYGMLGYGNRLMRFLINMTDPLLVPLRKRIRPVGMFDISPLVAFIIIWVLQVLVERIFLSGLTMRFFA